MFVALLIALAITAVITAVVVRLDLTKVGFRRLEKGEPDFVLGVIVIVLSAAMVLASVFYARDDASPSARIMMNTYATIGFSWGLSQVLGARKWAERRKQTSKSLHDEIARQ